MSTIVLPIPSRSRPLSSISVSGRAGSSKPLPPLPPRPHHAPSSGSRPSTSRASLVLVPPSVMRHGSLGSVLQEPRILARLLRYVRWHDFQSLALTCKSCSNVLHHPKLRDAVLSRFVPGYRYCLRHADADSISSIDVEFSDLSHFSKFSIYQLYEIHDNRQFEPPISGFTALTLAPLPHSCPHDTFVIWYCGPKREDTKAHHAVPGPFTHDYTLAGPYT